MHRQTDAVAAVYIPKGNCKQQTNQPQHSHKNYLTKIEKDTMTLEFVALPDDVLVCIGKAVLEFNGAESLVRLTRTAKRVHRILTNKEILRILLESENNRIFHQVFSADSYRKFPVPPADTLKQLAWCQKVANVKRQLIQNKKLIVALHRLHIRSMRHIKAQFGDTSEYVHRCASDMWNIVKALQSFHDTNHNKTPFQKTTAMQVSSKPTRRKNLTNKDDTSADIKIMN